jgi:hypothetical protein
MVESGISADGGPSASKKNSVSKHDINESNFDEDRNAQPLQCLTLSFSRSIGSLRTRNAFGRTGP